MENNNAEDVLEDGCFSPILKAVGWVFVLGFILFAIFSITSN